MFKTFWLAGSTCLGALVYAAVFLAVVVVIATVIISGVILSGGTLPSLAPESPNFPVASDVVAAGQIRWITEYRRDPNDALVLGTVWSATRPVCVPSPVGWQCSWPDEQRSGGRYDYLHIQTYGDGRVLGLVPVGYVMYVPAGMILRSLPISAAQR